MPSPSIGNKRSKTKLSAEPKNSIKTLKSTNGMKTRFTLDMDFKPYFAIIIIGNMNNIIKTITGVLGKYINKSALAKQLIQKILYIRKNNMYMIPTIVLNVFPPANLATSTIS